MFYCGIDVAKLKHVVSLMDEKGQVTRTGFTITNTRSGFDQLLETLQRNQTLSISGWKPPGITGWRSTMS